MLNKIIKLVIILLGALFGVFVGATIGELGFVHLSIFVETYVVTGVSCFIFAIIFYLLSPFIIKLGLNITLGLEKEIFKFSTTDIVYGTFGLLCGCLIAFLLSQPFQKLNIVGVFVSCILYLILGLLGIRISTIKKDDINNLGNMFFKKVNNKSKSSKGFKFSGCPKVLDTSVIIDGRITDICKTGFIEGPLVIPEFVLQELRHIADSADSLKRNRGRRGLDILNLLQKDKNIEVVIESKDFGDNIEVDVKLLKLAKELNGKVLTNDFNLNKVAEFQGVRVLNINELANSVKPVVLPGEEMKITIVKDGKESNQGLAYLDDGTMIVVEGGKKCIGVEVIVIVTSVLQTAAGRMIFAKFKSIFHEKVS